MTPARSAPGTRDEIGLINFALTRLLGLVAGTNPPNLFTTLGRRRRMFRAWLRFAATLMPGGSLPRGDTELVILRVAHNTGCEYEWRHHERLARLTGLTAGEIERVRRGPQDAGWSRRRRAILTAVDELHAGRMIGDDTWSELRGELSEADLIELCMLTGHYEMLAMTINSLGIEPDHAAGGLTGAVSRLIGTATNRRRQMT